MKSVSDRFQHDEAPTFYVKYEPYDLHCPQMPGDLNAYQSACVEKTKKGGPCHTVNCSVGHELRVSNGLKTKKTTTCLCGVEIGPLARSWVRNGYTEPTCWHCINRDKARARWHKKAKK